MSHPGHGHFSISGRRLAPALLLLPLITGLSYAQYDITGSYHLHGVHVAYTEVARDSASAADANSTYKVSVSWPSSSAAAAGAGFTLDLEDFVPGDTITAFETPETLMTPEGLANFPLGEISLVVALTPDNLFVEAGAGNTYPTTITVNCSTGAEVAPVTDNGVITLTSTALSLDEAAGTFTWGFGITQSQIFDLFVAPDSVQDVAGYPENWGKILAHFTPAGTQYLFDTLEVFWRAIDGLDTDAGIDAEGKLDRQLGVAALDGDTVIFAAMAGYGATLTPPIAINVPPSGSVAFGAPGIDGVGTVENANWGYLFDPAGDDEIPLNGDEPFQFTGYYFTFNFLTAASALADTFETGFTPIVDTDGDGIPDTPALIYYFLLAGLDVPSATIAAADSLADIAAQSVATAFGLDATSAAGIGAVVGASVSQALNDYLAGGGIDLVEAIDSTARVAVVTTVGALAAAGVTVDDSDHDFNGTNGRLLFEVDNNCIPTQQTRAVYGLFVNTEHPLGVETDDSIIPARFALHANYPNPFNPSTIIAFDLPAKLETEISIWNLLGQQVRTLHTGELTAGEHRVSFDGRNNAGQPVPTGVYFYRVKAGQYISTRKMMLLK